MNVLILFASLCSVSLAALMPRQSSFDDGCPPIKSVGLHIFMCGVGCGSTSGCPGDEICCPTPCGGTTCVHGKPTTVVAAMPTVVDEGETKRAACPPGLPTVNCLVSPCMFATCDSPTAYCVADYCGGCNANWVDVNGHHVQC